MTRAFRQPRSWTTRRPRAAAVADPRRPRPTSDRRTSRTTVLPLVLLTAVALSAPSAAAPADTSDDASAGAETSVTWTIAPATAEGPDSRISLRHPLDPGTSIVDHVAVTNFSPQAVGFDVYASDGTVTADGAFDLVPPGDPETADGGDGGGGGSWIQIGEVADSTPRDGGGVTVEIAAESTVVVPITIAVPENATPGDHPAGIVAELAQDPDAQVQVVSRVGVRAHLRVNGDLAPTLEPTVDSIRWAPSWNPFAAGTVTVTYAVANTGNIRLGSGETLAQVGLLGVGSDDDEQAHDEILPGQVVSTTADLRTWPVFRTTGTLTVTPSIVGADEVPVELQQTAVTYTAWTVPWSQLALLALLVGGILLRRRARRRRDLAVELRVREAVEAATSSERESAKAGG